MAAYYRLRINKSKDRYAGLLLLTAILLVPSMFPEKTGWLMPFVPLPFFFYYVSLGKNKGLLLIRNAVLLAAGIALIAGALPSLFFTFTLVPLAAALSYGVFYRKSPAVAGFWGALALIFTWFLYWSGLAMAVQVNPYTALLVELDKGLSNGLMLYEKSAELAPETLASVRKGVELLRLYIPKILPALLLSALLGVVWLNLVLGNWLLRKKDSDIVPWPEFIEWKLPEPFVWLVVLSGTLFLLLPQPLRLLGLNGLIICSTVYFFQGLAIAASLLNRWSVPGLIRILIYALIFIQTYGIILLSCLGLLDVWADFRKLDRPAGDSGNGSS